MGGGPAGFFKLAGAVITVCAACAWAAGRSALDGAGGRAELAVQALGVFALAAVAWQVLLYARQPAAARWVGIAALVPGFAATILLARVSGRPLLGLAALLARRCSSAPPSTGCCSATGTWSTGV